MAERPGSHPGERLPGLSLVERQPARRGGKRRAVAATAPRPGLERKTAIALECGHYTDSDAVAFFSVWQPREDEGQPQLRCETCHEWQPARAIPASQIPPTPMF